MLFTSFLRYSRLGFVSFASLTYLSQSAYSFGKYFNGHKKAVGAIDRISHLHGVWEKNQARISSRFDSLEGDNIAVCSNLSVAYPGATARTLRGLLMSFNEVDGIGLQDPLGVGRRHSFERFWGCLKVLLLKVQYDLIRA